jgi:hypothetical protein
MDTDARSEQREAMRSHLARVRPNTPAIALGHLRATFPEAALSDRVEAFADWRSSSSQAT